MIIAVRADSKNRIKNPARTVQDFLFKFLYSTVTVPSSETVIFIPVLT